MLCMLALAPASTMGAESGIFKAAAQEATNCFAFYMMLKRCAPTGAKDSELRKVTSDINLSFALMTTFGKAAGQLRATILANELLAIDSAGDVMKGDCANLGRLANPEGPVCKALLENPMRRLDQIRTEQEKAGSH